MRMQVSHNNIWLYCSYIELSRINTWDPRFHVLICEIHVFTYWYVKMWISCINSHLTHHTTYFTYTNSKQRKIVSSATLGCEFRAEFQRIPENFQFRTLFRPNFFRFRFRFRSDYLFPPNISLSELCSAIFFWIFSLKKSSHHFCWCRIGSCQKDIYWYDGRQFTCCQ